MGAPKIRAVPSCIPQMPVYYETFSARNFNTSPLTISGLKGDSYDYTLMIWTNGSTSSGYFYLTLNSDTGTNYRDYGMRGRGTSAAAQASDTASRADLFETGSTGNTEKLAIATITGSSGEERYIDDIHISNDSTNHSIWKKSLYWKNTADEMTNITFTCGTSITVDATIALFAQPKDLSENWELVKEFTPSAQDISSGGTPLSLTGLTGDTDIQYKLEVYLDTAADEDIIARINSDSGSNYTHQQLGNNGGSISAANHTTTSINLTYSTTGDMQNYSAIINAESGVKRLITGSWGNNKSSAGFEQIESAIWWNNTADEITSLEISTINTSSATGTVRLWKKKNPDTVADKFNLPFKMLKEVAVSGDFSAGHTFSGLTGDSVLMYKLEFLGDGNPELRMQINSDVGSNYIRQYLRGNSSTTSATSLTQTSFLVADPTVLKQTALTLYIFPQSGENRPMLGDWCGNENDMQIHAGWWSNTADEITSLKLYASNTNTVTGKFRLSYIPLPE